MIPQPSCGGGSPPPKRLSGSRGAARLPLFNLVRIIPQKKKGATVPDWAVCRVPAGRTAVLAQLRDEFTGWWRLYSAQPADTPLPSDVTEQLDDAAQQVQTAYMDYVLLDARTLRSAKRGPADPGGAGGPSRRQRQHRSRSTSSLMSLGSFCLVDPWASKRGGAKGYTHPATPKPATPARLDRWYVSATAAPWVVDVARTYGAPGDHNGVLLTLSLPDLPHAHREQWRFPTYLLFHPSLRLELEQRLEAHVAANPVASTGDGACTQWEADKFFLREAATSIHRRHARQTRDGLHGVVLAADAAAALADRPGASAAQRQAAAMANLAVREERAAAAAASHNARAALMEEHGERGTRWFHRQADEPAAGAQEPITHLKVPGQPAPVALTGPGTRNTVSAAAAAMYSSTSPTGLFRVQPVCTASQQQLLAAIDRKVPADLHTAAEGSGDGALSDAELMAALAGSANGKAPGSDGVPYEVYKVFWALLGPRLCAAAAAAFAAAADAHDGGEMAAALPASWREGIITLIYKGKSLDRAELASYRPITLLNCDFKMVSKAVSARLQPALDAVVDELQTAFITGRWIGDNALYLQGLIEWMRLDVGADGAPRQGDGNKVLQLSRLELCGSRDQYAHQTAYKKVARKVKPSLYSAQPADTPLPSDVTEQLDDAAQQQQQQPQPPRRCRGRRGLIMRPPVGAANLRLLTVNVNGLGSPLKARALVSHLQQVGADVAMVQETHATDTTALESCLRAAQGACLPWRHCLAASPAASPHSCGAAILARSRLSLPGCVLQPPSTDAAGRVVCWDWDVGHLRLRFVCVYAPTAVADKPAFFAGLHPHLATDRVLVVGGDWNCVTDASQEAAPSPSRAAGAPQLASLLAQFSLVDPWASKRGGAKGYTHPATPKPANPARLDRWYVSATAAPWVVDVARTYGAPGDHNGVLLTLSLPELPHAHREQWRFPTYLLFHPSLRLELEQRLEAHVAANPVASTGDGACTQWEADKFFLREAATSIHRRHARQTRDGLQGVVLAADTAAALADRPDASAAQRQAAAMANLAVREERAAAAAASHNARAALMEEHGERGTRWFHRQADEPAAGAQEPITHLKVPGQPAPVALTGPGTRNTVSAAAAAMYSSTSPTGLFRVQPVCTASQQQQLLAAIDRKVPADLHAAAEGSGDGALSDAELMAALAGSANGKAPGSDGVPYEVYKVFWALLGPRLCAAAAAAFAAAADAHDGFQGLPASWREGIITLIYKGKSLDRAELASYRPITLLNCDFKMVSKAVSARLQPALDAVVDELQTAFITGRWIGDNALYLQGLIEWMRLDVGADGSPRQGGALYFLDIEKAYDRVHRQWLYASAEGLGFGPRMLRWIRLLTANGSARVCVNGMLSDAFPVLNGLPQGSTASPPLWVIQMQPLTSFLRRQVEQGALRTPLLPSGEQAPPAAHHADDTTLTARDPAVDGPVLMAAVQLFCRASNARVHPDKSKAMGLGRFAHLTGPCPHK
ncbi:hypothetical protein CHLRE_06g278302v5 [Chlamydomonas reinhardtii]|uniref:Reverse transcriptase domain-containing protein n=1 Tax=Chlamydomonas reinhardtii TaxID=3055 RepID=A0A2K3DPI7_CHLRE|nr:uncharacterized protein CHLRE_06g278302v5 [Chlamydomonas reinhardtii]PNW82418.1 hypothetical protein CHLRE_06g278302v5 [Chlamydomonas reinhardtii]